MPPQLGEGDGAFARRSVLRSATLVMPATGQKVKRVVTLREPVDVSTAQDGVRDSAESTNTSENTPLLSRQDSRYSNGHAMRKRRMLHDQSKRSLQQVLDYMRSRTGIGILKCSLAYLLGTMPTFIPFLSDFLGQSFGKHLVATITVYFHPARSLGSMIEAFMCAAVAFIYATVVCFTSMGVSIFFDEQLGLITLGHVIVLIVFCGGGLGFVGWVKQRLSNPLVNVACSLTSIAIITVLTKEGAVQAADFSPHKIVQVLKMIIMGVCASTIVSLAIKPVSARKDLRQNLVDVTDSLGDMLSMIATAFLSGAEEDLEQKVYQTALDRYKKTSAAMTKNLKESKLEHYALGTECQAHLEMRLVKSIQQMAQSLGGLRSAATTQFDLLSQTAAGTVTPVVSSMSKSWSGSGNFSSTIEEFVLNQENFATLEAIAETPEEDDGGSKTPQSYKVIDTDGMPTARAPSEIFERFIVQLGPSMKSLAYTLKLILDDLPCGPAPAYQITVDTHFHSSLVDAINLYSNARKKALALLYRGKDLAASRPEAVEADFEEVAASCGHFSYSLLSFAEEMKTYLDVLGELKGEIEQPTMHRSWKWLRFWRKGSSKPAGAAKADLEQPDLLVQYTSNSSPSADYLNGNAGPILEFQKTQPKRTFQYRIYKASHFFRRDDVKFAIKVGAGAAIYATPSFVPAWRPFYSLWRGEWGLLSYMLVCSMTIGASNTTSFARAFGTFVGAICSVIAWKLSGGNVFLLAFFGWIMSLWNFYLIVGRGKGPFGRFIMLTYNLSALYAYALSVQSGNHDKEEGGKKPLMVDIALHRVVAVTSGCLWGMFITRVVWPISARRKFRNGLSLLLLRMGLVWKRDPLALLTGGPSQHSYLELKEELQLQKYLRQLESLCSSASSEFQLKGPFAGAAYSRILRSLGRMLDAFHAMNVIIQTDPNASEGEAALLQFTAAERAQLCSRISHLFQVLASSVKLQFPLNDALPNTDSSRDRLLAKVFKFRKEHNEESSSNDEDYALLYACALVTGQISSEIREVAKELEKLFGTLDEEHLKLK